MAFSKIREKIMEEWRSIKNWPNYEVSNLGRVRRRSYVRNNRVWPEVIKKLFFDEDWGYSVVLYDYPRSKEEVVARLILTAFVREPFPNELARHLDDNKTNNILQNLAWGTAYDNAEDAGRNGKLRTGSSHGMSKLTEEQVSEIKSLYKYKSSTHGTYALAKMYSVNQGTIFEIVKGSTWKHVSSDCSFG